MNGTSRAQVTGTVVAVVVTAAIVTGIYELGSPSEERARRLDERRVQDLSGIARAADVYWTRHMRLPASLEALQTETGANITIADPDTGMIYEFRPLEGEKYELCAVFNGESRDSERGVDAGFWSHRDGRQCFQRAAELVR
jgi:hypothetical protein